MARVLVALLLLTGLAGGALAEIRAPWSGLQGTWRGKGTGRENPDGELETVVCRATLAGGTAESLIMSGRCANAVRSARFEILLDWTQGAGRVRAVARSRLYPESVTFTGAASQERLSLKSRDPVQLEGRRYDVRLSLTAAPDASRFTMRQSVSAEGEGSRAVMLDMTFERR